MNPLEALDQGAHPWFLLLRRPWLDPLMVLLTTLGSRPVLTAIVVLLDLFFLIQRRGRAALILTGVALAAVLVDVGVKELVRRPRPEAVRPLAPPPTSWSFPSGHALCSTAICVTAAFLLTSTSQQRRRNLALLVAALLALLIGFSRLYLGFHYLTDVLGGWSAGLALALVGLWLDERGRRATQSVG